MPAKTTLCALAFPFHLSLGRAFQTFWRKMTCAYLRLSLFLGAEKVASTQAFQDWLGYKKPCPWHSSHQQGSYLPSWSMQES